MRCPNCRAENADTARFCGDCGQQLTPSCPHCAAAVGPDLRFCTNCGGSLSDVLSAATSSFVEAPSERRLVSVLFVDLEGFSTLAEAMDPEDVRNLQGRYFESARAVVARYRGTLEKFIGDAVMAVWGAPIAHEDDAERAVRAALELVDAVARLRGPQAGRRLAARAAVATGEVAVTMGLDGQGLVAGDLVNTAARLQTVAPAGRVLVDEATMRTAQKGVTFEAAGRASLRGKSRRLAVWLADTATVGRVAAAGSSHSGAFVGRQHELAELLDLVARSSAERRSRLVSIVGIAGIGKSRLVWELRQSLDAAPQTVALHVGRAPSYGEGITFAPLAEMVRRRAGIPEGMEPELARRQLAATLATLVADDADRRWIEPRLATLIDPQAVADFEAEELFAAWRRFFEHVADWAPTLLIFEDLQWAEPQMLDFIDHLATWSRGHPLVTLALARPELLDRRPTWGAAIPNYAAIHLQPLEPAEMRELLAGLAPELTPDFVEQIVQQAGGVPLYAVEVVRMLLDRGASARRKQVGSVATAGTLDVPDSLRSLVAARLDALPAPDRDLVHAAAVLGRRFHPDALAAVGRLAAVDAVPRIGTLMKRELLAVDEDLHSPGRGKLSFVQDVVRDIAYRTLSRRERSALHLAAADYLGGLGDEELVEAQAEHLYEAHAAARDTDAAAPIAKRAVSELAVAARRAMTLRVPERALEHLQRALEMVVEPDVRTTLLADTALAARAAARFDVAEEVLRLSIAAADERGDRRAGARARAQLASVLLSEERHASAIGDLEEALSNMGDATADPIGVELLGQLARANVLIGANEAAIEQSQRALAAARRLDLPALAVDALTTLGTARARKGDEGAGLADLRTAVEEAELRGIVRAELRARNNLAWLAVLDDPHVTLQTARAGLDVALRMGVGDMAVQLALVVCVVSVELGNWVDALALIDDARTRPSAASHRADLAASEAMIRSLRGDRAATAALDQLTLDAETDRQAQAGVDLARAWHALLAGDYENCLRLADAATEHSLGADQWAAMVIGARACLWSGDAAAARIHIERLEAASGPGRAAEAALHTAQAGGAALAGDSAAADKSYTRAVDGWRALDVPLPLALCLAERHALLQRDAVKNSADLHEAEAILTSLGARGAVRAVRRLARYGREALSEKNSGN
jgi:class 3 adenylate cyclase